MTTRIMGAHELSPEELAEKISLRYVHDDTPGVQRRRAGQGFTYISPSGRVIKSARIKEWIGSLAIPPAWTDVWICPRRDGHILATGRDDVNRKQYIYHPHWQQAASAIKFERMRAFGERLPAIRRRVLRDFNSRDCKTRLLAGMVRLLDVSLIRVGNEEYTLQNGSYGLATLRNEHLKINGKSVTIRFPGKGGLKRKIAVDDCELVRFLQTCRESGNGRLFSYRTAEEELCELHAGDLNEYLAAVSEGDFTAKDFRTWKGTCIAAWHLYEHPEEPTKTGRKKQIIAALDEAAELLGNTRSVCRAHYVHPAILEMYEAGRFSQACAGMQLRRQKQLGKDEQLTLHLLEHLED